jgi:murein DD-endopeptidase MepM/ murein hydrolase activator NlpD
MGKRLEIIKARLALLAAVALIIAIAFFSHDINVFFSEKISGYPGEILAYNGKITMPVSGYTLTYGYGNRTDPINGQPAFHNGLDLATAEGTAVRAVKDGKIAKIDYQPEGLGNFILIEHADGTYTVYGHLSKINSLNVGQEVGSGSVIGAVGSTGRSTGPHLHFILMDSSKTSLSPCAMLGITDGKCDNTTTRNI